MGKIRYHTEIYLFVFTGCSRIVPSNISSCFDDGKFHGAQSLLGLVAQQFQFRRAQIEERGKRAMIFAYFILECIFNVFDLNTKLFFEK